jgi:hypothetical protein
MTAKQGRPGEGLRGMGARGGGVGKRAASERWERGVEEVGLTCRPTCQVHFKTTEGASLYWIDEFGKEGWIDEFGKEGCLVLQMRKEKLTNVIDKGGKHDFFHLQNIFGFQC